MVWYTNINKDSYLERFIDFIILEVIYMKYNSVADMAKKWNISERSVRNYCAHGRVEGAILKGKTWSIPEDAVKPERINKKPMPEIQIVDMCAEFRGGNKTPFSNELMLKLTEKLF